MKISDDVSRLDKLGGLYSHILWSLNTPWPSLTEQEKRRIYRLKKEVEHDIDEIISYFDFSKTELFLLKEVILKHSSAFSFLGVKFHEVVYTLRRLRKEEYSKISSKDVFDEFFDRKGSLKVKKVQEALNNIRERLGLDFILKNRLQKQVIRGRIYEKIK